MALTETKGAGMSCRFWMVLSASLLVAALPLSYPVYTVSVSVDAGISIAASARAGEPKQKKSSGPPPLVVDKKTPLLLDDPPEEDPFAVPEGPVVDNTACFCCHINYEEEPFALVHAKANVGCMKCHGKSLDHRNDEDNITPPEVMFPAGKIGKNCVECHDEHDVPAREVIARWRERRLEKTDLTKLVCTDCHGNHRLKLRTVRWNKATGELIIPGEPKPVPIETAPEQPRKKPQP